MYNTSHSNAILFLRKAKEFIEKARALRNSPNCNEFLKESKNSFILIARALLALKGIDTKGLWNPQNLSSVIERIEPRAKGIHEKALVADISESTYQDLCRAANLYLELTELLIELIRSINTCFII